MKSSQCEYHKMNFLLANHYHKAISFVKYDAMRTSYRSSHRRCSIKKGVLRKNFAKFKQKHLCRSLFFNKVAGPRLWHRRFPVNFVKFLRTSFFIEHLWWLLLNRETTQLARNNGFRELGQFRSVLTIEIM